MRLVLDTNVLVAALLNPGRTPDRTLDACFAAGVTVLLDRRIEDEYTSVLARSKFASIPSARKDALLARVASCGEQVVPAVFESEMIDADDRMFVEVALGGAATAIVTGNGKHFPRGFAFEVLAPAELLARLEAHG